MNVDNLHELLSDIETYLGRERAAADSGAMRSDRAYWDNGRGISAQDIALLALLGRDPASAAAIAAEAGRDPASVCALLDALAAIGVVEHEAGGYRNALATHLYLQALEEPGDQSTFIRRQQ